MTQSGHDGLEIAAVQNAVRQVKWKYCRSYCARQTLDDATREYENGFDLSPNHPIK